MKAALLLVDVQLDLLRRPGLVPDAAALERQLIHVLDGFRRKRLPVLHSRLQIASNGSGRMPHWVRSGLQLCVEGTSGAAPPAALAALESEPVFIKPFFSAFGNLALEPTLRAENVDTVVIAGAYTHACIRATVLDAYQAGFAVWVVADAVTSDAPLHASLSLDYLDDRACEVLPFDEIARRLGWLRVLYAASAPCDTVPVSHVAGCWQAERGHALWLQHDPSDWQRCLTAVPLGRADDVERAAKGQVRAQQVWAQRPITERATLLARWANALLTREDAFVELLAGEIGKPAADGRAEVRYALALLQATLRRAEADGTEFALDHRVHVRSRPLGVVALITPWNNPLSIPVGKIAPALVWGNSVLWKPALQAPRIAMLLIDSLLEAGIPSNSVNLVFGDAHTAQSMVMHADIAAVSFTGSTKSGREVAFACAANGKRLQAELGGNNAVIVGRSAEVALVANRLATLAFSFSGQRCTAPRRLIIAREVHREFTEALLSAVAALRIGEPGQQDTQVGPLISLDQRSRIAQAVSTCIDEGGAMLRGGQVPAGFERGCWYEPTILRVANGDFGAVRQETFGPLVLLMVADDIEEAIALCNGVEQGLVASLYSLDPEEQRRFLDQAQAGILRVNDMVGTIHPDAPFGGCKSSGFGIPEHGRWDRDFYSIQQAVYGVLSCR